MGEVVCDDDTVKILSTKERDFLERNNGDKVKIESLTGKTICIFFVSLYKRCDYADSLMVLEEVYNELYPKNVFEVVFVAETEDGGGSQKMKKQKIEVKELFKNIFSKMSWLSIPFTDVETRKRLCKLLYKPTVCGSDIAILDPTGKVLSLCGRSMLDDYGAEGYPFTHQRIKEIREEDQVVRDKLCLKTLLNSPSCDFVIRNDSKKVPISELEEKVVGLYMYSDESNIKEKLVEVYNELQKNKEVKFEIILVNFHFYCGSTDQNSFQQNFEEMPWLALPFMDKRIRKVWRVFDRPGIGLNDEGILVIIGPGGNFVETHSSTIVEFYGIEAYPFTKKRAVEIEKIKQKEVTLDSLLAKAHKDYVIDKYGNEIPFSNLKGKSILLYFPCPIIKLWGEVVPKLKEWYEEIRGKDDKFEMILVSSDTTRRKFDEFFPKMPWLAFPPDVPVYGEFLEILGHYSVELVAFGTDGHLVTKEALQRLKNHGANAYPFTDDNLDEEIYRELEMKLSWIC